MRTYVADLPGGTATTNVQIQAKTSLHRIVLSFLSAAVGKIEVSLNAVPQIGTAQPTADVIARVNCSATAGNVVSVIEFTGALPKLVPFQTIYIHQTGTGNIGDVNLVCT